jgi:acetyl-CoA C-acetyltransferase
MSHSQIFRFATKKNFGKPAYIVAAKRTPIGSFLGKLSKLTAVELGGIAINAAIKSINLDPKKIDEVLLGNVLQAGQGQAPARQAALKGGVDKNVPCTTINKVCSSGMKSVMFGAQSIALGYNNIVLAGGFESMSNAPFYLTNHRKGVNFGDQKIYDSIMYDGLTDVYNKITMGACAEKTVKDSGLTRQGLDEFTIMSYTRVAESTKAGKFKDDIVPVTIDKDTITEDEEFPKLKKDKLPNLKPSFTKDGAITAANSSKINDGAIAIILMSEEEVTKHNIKPLGRILGYSDAEVDPIDFCIAPYYAVTRLLEHTGTQLKNIDAVEINEAFAATVLANMKMMDLGADKVNVHGGAVALGHPIGMSGARIIQALLRVLKDKKGKLGIAGICNGGGGASSILIENLQ